MVGTKETDEKTSNIINGINNHHLCKVDYQNNITVLDLTNRKISSLSEELIVLPNLTHLNISHNRLTEVPKTVMNLKNLAVLDISYNSIIFFDDPPSFCDTIEKLDISNNKLEGPPLWVWVEKPKELSKLNISNNKFICQSLVNGYFEELLQYNTLVYEIDIHNCNLNKHMKLLATCCNCRVISLGCKEYNCGALNQLEHLPCSGLDKCLDVEKLYLSNTQIYDINSDIDIFKYLKELDLSQNYIHSLPNEFSNLENLQICILSYNKLLYLPDNLNKLSKLERLYLNNNELCMLPDNLQELPCLKTLDLYSNYLCDGLEFLHSLEELDLAQNYFIEPDDEKYLMKKDKLRLNCIDRLDGQKLEAVRDESEYSHSEIDDEELYDAINNGCQVEQVSPCSRSSTPEDWDSDEYWIPLYLKPITPPRSPWLFFVKKKMEEGNFCPMDAHPISIAEKVKYEKMINPQPEYESDGQFDDYSGDES
ncbi:unnamed protein product [Chrysodeixis includens]|uniref:Leucine rich repeat protein n=1 Tax=Chrysodeixis includens TaxID=689277 RepID=A0A9P0BLA9_CHRIL|nr:unnamed protein product [Chrysodeixis includens]